MRKWLISLLLGTSAIWAAGAAAAAATLTENDFQYAVNLRSPAISPDGKHGVAIVSRVAWNEDRWNSDLVLFDLTAKTHRTLTYERKGLSDPSFSPDGTRLAFIAVQGSGDEARSQVFVMPLDGGDAKLVTKAKEGVDQFAWRPDGEAIAYVATDSKAELKGADKFRDSFVFTTLPIVAREDPRPSRLYVTTLANGANAQITSGSTYVATGEAASTISWSADGKTIAFASVPSSILNEESSSRIATVDVASREVRALTSQTAWQGTPLFSPDGTHVGYTDARGDNQVHLDTLYAIAPSGGGEPKALSTQLDRPVQDWAWSPDSKSAYVAVPDRARTAIFHVGLNGGTPTRIDFGELNLGSSLQNAIARDGSMFFVASAAKRPPELYVRANGGMPVKLTDYNAALGAFDLATAERIAYPTSLGIPGDGVLYTPPGYVAGKKYPLVIFIHGGPTSSSTLGFDFWAQVMAARGWLVLRPNYRGSTDLGLAYQRAVLYDPEDGPGKDIVSALDVVRARGIVDEKRIAVSGWSYGGIMTAWMISKYHIWNSAVSGASVNDWITDYGTADDSLADIDLFHGSPFLAANTEEWRKASAITYAADVTTPVLILSDVGDNRDPFATSSMYWRALRDNRKEATLRVWPVDGHFPRDPVRTVDVYHYWIDFIATHFAGVKGPGNATSPSSPRPMTANPYNL